MSRSQQAGEHVLFPFDLGLARLTAASLLSSTTERCLR